MRPEAQARTAGEVDLLLRGAGPGSRVHLVGAGGCGMSGLGHLLLDLAHEVTGSDLVENEETRQLRERGARLQCGHAPAMVRSERPVLVVHTSAVRADNAELQAARELGIPVVGRAVLLAALLHRQLGVCVAGMHGKTTTSALLAFALEQLGARPSFAVGARVPQLPRSGRFSQPARDPQPWFVIEADESDGTLGLFHPQHALLLNIDAEHLDHYQGLPSVEAEFARFAAQVPGLTVYCRDDENLSRLLQCRPGAVSYGFHPQADYRIEAAASAGAPQPQPPGAEPGTRPASGTFAIRHRGASLGVFSTLLLGEMNRSNAAAVVAWLHASGFESAAIARAIAPFRGATRRQQLLYADDCVRIYDDYGHHPSEIRATLRAFRELGPARLLVAFQPHRFTRTLHLLQEFATCFAGADELWLTEIYPASEAPIPGVSGAVLAEAVRARGQAAHYWSALDDLGEAVRKAARPGDLILFLGAGDITKVAHLVAAKLAAGCSGNAVVAGPSAQEGLRPGLARATLQEGISGIVPDLEGCPQAPVTVARPTLRREPGCRQEGVFVG